MTADLFWLLLTALLAASLWIPFIVGLNSTPYAGGAEHDFFVIPPDHHKMVPWVHRAFRAHQNLLEQFMPYAVIVLVGHSLGVHTAITAWCTMLFFWLRVAHAVGMITAWARLPVRPIIFTAGWIIILVHAWQVFAHARPA
ncbi:MAG: MAPEG family protein [Hyphomicrobiaceae bacterium]